jgi:hypothetical protein
MDMEGEWEVQFGVVNDASADEVKVVIELSSWHDVSGSFGPYPGVGPEIQEYTDVSGRYPRYITPAYPSSSGCDRG